MDKHSRLFGSVVSYNEKSFVTLASALIRASGSSTLPQGPGLRLRTCLKEDSIMLFCLSMESLALKQQKAMKKDIKIINRLVCLVLSYNYVIGCSKLMAL